MARRSATFVAVLALSSYSGAAVRLGDDPLAASPALLTPTLAPVIPAAIPGAAPAATTQLPADPAAAAIPDTGVPAVAPAAPGAADTAAAVTPDTGVAAVAPTAPAAAVPAVDATVAAVPPAVATPDGGAAPAAGAKKENADTINVAPAGGVAPAPEVATPGGVTVAPVEVPASTAAGAVSGAVDVVASPTGAVDVAANVPASGPSDPTWSTAAPIADVSSRNLAVPSVATADALPVATTGAPAGAKANVATEADQAPLFEYKGPAAVSLLCQQTVLFFDGTDFDVAHRIYAAYVENQEHSIFAAAGTNDGRDVIEIVKQPWYKPGKATIYGWEASGVVAKAADEAAKNVSNDITIFHNALSDTDGKLIDTVGYDGTQGIDPGTMTTVVTNASVYDGSSRQAKTLRLSTWIRENSIATVDYLLLDVEGHEEFAIAGMDLDKLKYTFPVFQWELGVTWVDGRPAAGSKTQGEMVTVLENLGYHIYLMGADLDQQKPLLLRTTREFYDQAKCITDPGTPPFVPGNALAVHKSVFNADFKENQKPWLVNAIGKMVERGNALVAKVKSASSPISPSFVIVIMALLQFFA